ncbi:MAG: hypothetical protein Q9167_007812 [Letrouitia subvulpina]
MAAPQPNIQKLLQQIVSCTQQLTGFLDDKQLPKPTFLPDCPDIPGDPTYETLRVNLNQTAKDLLLLVNGPKNFLRTFHTSAYDLAACQVALDFGFFEAIPVHGTRKLSELASAVGVDEGRVGSVIRLLATQRIFEEVGPDVFSHTATSALVAQNAEIRAAIHKQMDEFLQAASETSNWIKGSPHGTDGYCSPFHYRHQAPLYDFYDQNPVKGRRFAEAMIGVTKMNRKINELRDAFPWGSLGKGTIVDMGGGNGHISKSLALDYPNLSFIVQDNSPVMLNQISQTTSSAAQPYDRVRFMHHSFFDPQPVAPASAYFIRSCIHNWPDEDCIRIFRALVPALERCASGTPFLINETILPDLGTRTGYEERDLRQLDLCMMVALGAKQRTRGEFQKLLKEADGRYRVSGFDPNQNDH